MQINVALVATAKNRLKRYETEKDTVGRDGYLKGLITHGGATADAARQAAKEMGIKIEEATPTPSAPAEKATEPSDAPENKSTGPVQTK